MISSFVVSISVLMGALPASSLATSYPACAPGITCNTITPPDKPNLTFTCAQVESPTPAKGMVYFMHGNDGKLSKGMWFDLMLQLAPLGFNCLACDARGYSPGANPDQMAAYNYNNLASDIFSIVNASGFSQPFDGKFHIVAHDQGARVSWHSIALGEGRRRLLSFASLSIPHSDVFSDALYGPTADPKQQQAAQYVREIVLPNSVTTYNGAIFKTMCRSDGWDVPSDCQHISWWYNGAIDSGAMALSPMLPFGAVAKWLGIPEDVVKNLTQYPISGVPQTVKVGHVEQFPVLYACGALDSSDLCEQGFAIESGNLIKNYTYLKLPDCGHGVMTCGNSAQLQQLHSAIITNIQSVYA